MERVMSVIGILVQIGICYALSTNRKKINWKLVGWACALQLVFAVLILKTDPGRAFFSYMNDIIIATLGFTRAGASFVFGNLTAINVPVGLPIIPAGPAPAPPAMAGAGVATGAVQLAFAPGAERVVELGLHAGQYANVGAFFAFGVLPTIIFFGSLMTVLYHLGVMQRVVYAVAWVMQRTMKTSGAESLSAAANIFVGQTEAPLVIKPYIAKMTLSELNCVMCGGMATIAGGVMAAYVGMLESQFKDIAGHLMAASVMSAPAALMFAKIMVPETEVPETSGQLQMNEERLDQNVIDAAARGASEGMQLAINVAAMLIAFIALIAMGNHLWGLGCAAVSKLTGASLASIDSLQKVIGLLNAPLAWLMGVESRDLVAAGQLLGEKTILNEFVAYAHLGRYVNGQEMGPDGPIMLQPRTVVIMTYACCGFANFGSIGIQLGGIGGLAPHRRGDLARLGLRALVAGTFASYMTANIAGLLI